MNSAKPSHVPIALALVIVLAILPGCGLPPSARLAMAGPEEAGLRVVRTDGHQGVLLAYYQQVQRMSTHELAKERTALAALVATPGVQVRQAMVLGQPRNPLDLGRALALLENVLKLAGPEATPVHPLARMLADQYSERLKLENQVDKSNQQLKESLRREEQLQEKIEALTDIERSLPPRPRTMRPAGSGAAAK
ncbi:MAG: permease [Betaproteobacteria bacterium]